MKDMLKYTNNRYVNKCIIHNSEHFNDELRNIEIKRNTLLAFVIRQAFVPKSPPAVINSSYSVGFLTNIINEPSNKSQTFDS